MYVQNFINYLQKVRRYSQRTVKSYAENLSMFKMWLDKNNITSVTSRDIANYVVYMMETKRLQPTSVNQHLSSLRSYYDYCCRFENVCCNPAAGVRDVRTPKRLPKFITEERMNHLIDNLLPSTDFKRMRTRIIILIFYHCGLRCDELTNLHDNSINLTNDTMKVVGKGNKERIIPFGHELHDEIVHYLKLRAKEVCANCSQFIQTIFGTPCTSFQIRRITKIALLRIVPAPLAHPHILRHTFATVLMNHGARIEYVRLLMGHASADTTAIYQHVSIGYLQNSYNNIFK